MKTEWDILSLSINTNFIKNGIFDNFSKSIWKIYEVIIIDAGNKKLIINKAKEKNYYAFAVSTQETELFKMWNKKNETTSAKP